MSTGNWGALIGGSALAIFGTTRRSPLGIAMAVVGGTIALLGARPKSGQESATWTSVLVNCTPEEAYRFWRNFEDFPQFMKRIHTVTKLDDRRSRWVALGPMGQPIRWDAEITNERENEFIEWQSLENSDVQVNGRVEFEEVSPERGTLIRARIEYGPVAGLGALSTFLNKGLNFAIRQDLRRLEALLEAGEIPTVEGQPHGRRDAVTGILRLADPARPVPRDSSVKDAFTARRSVA
jgi:uncharacterized membrane protein